MSQPGTIAVVMSLLLPLLASAAPVSLVTGDNFPPYVGTTLPEGGMLTALVTRAMQLAGDQPSVETLPWKRGYELTRLGRYDATYPYARTREREADFLYSDLVYGGNRMVYTRPGSGIDPADAATFRGKTYCLPIGFAIYPQIEKLVAEGVLKIEQAASLTVCAKMLLLGRADLFVTDSVVGDAVLDQAGTGGKVVRLDKPFDRAEFYLIVPRARPDAAKLVERFNRAMRMMRASGETERIVRRHIEK